MFPAGDCTCRVWRARRSRGRTSGLYGWRSQLGAALEYQCRQLRARAERRGCVRVELSSVLLDDRFSPECTTSNACAGGSEPSEMAGNRAGGGGLAPDRAARTGDHALNDEWIVSRVQRALSVLRAWYIQQMTRTCSRGRHARELRMRERHGRVETDRPRGGVGDREDRLSWVGQGRRCSLVPRPTQRVWEYCCALAVHP